MQTWQTQQGFGLFVCKAVIYIYLRGVENLKSMLTDLQNEWDKLFPPDVNFGDLNIPNFTFQDFSTTF